MELVFGNFWGSFCILEGPFLNRKNGSAPPSTFHCAAEGSAVNMNQGQRYAEIDQTVKALPLVCQSLCPKQGVFKSPTPPPPSPQHAGYLPGGGRVQVALFGQVELHGTASQMVSVY